MKWVVFCQRLGKVLGVKGKWIMIVFFVFGGIGFLLGLMILRLYLQIGLFVEFGLIGKSFIFVILVSMGQFDLVCYQWLMIGICRIFWYYFRVDILQCLFVKKRQWSLFVLYCVLSFVLEFFFLMAWKVVGVVKNIFMLYFFSMCQKVLVLGVCMGLFLYNIVV